ncbi:MAG: hypothetical protein OEZ38_06185 [Gammaproteobacteria bacterium]|nr:hypothetical protein [Gammaproteobacteria bacterium]
MKSFKAILAGCAFIVILGLLLQLLYIFVAVAYIDMAKSYPFLNDISHYFRYLVGLPVFFLLMFGGGYITANLAPENIVRNCLLVAMITMSITVLSALSYSSLTMTGMFVIILSLLSTLTGGLYWRRHQLPGY